MHFTVMTRSKNNIFLLSSNVHSQQTFTNVYLRGSFEKIILRMTNDHDGFLSLLLCSAPSYTAL